jgi:23S rRNA pseudouridine1911/1915/1917 synthase
MNPPNDTGRGTNVTGGTVPEFVVTADRGDSGRRLDVVLCRHLAQLHRVSRARVQSWIERGYVTLNGRLARRTALRVAAGDRLTVASAAPLVQRSHPAPENLPLDVLFEDETCLAVNKAAGVVIHPAYRHVSGTLINALLWRARDWSAGQRPSLLGRLDRGTSGVVIVAKSAASHAALQRALHSGRAAKEYLAITYGRVPRRGRIEMLLSRDSTDRRRVTVASTDGTPSVTTFENLAPLTTAGVSVVRCGLVTGRMHQIRVHFAARGWPLVGDATYGGKRPRHIADPRLAERLQRFPRQALHAWHVAFDHPITGARLQIEAPVPEDLRGLLDEIGFKGVEGFKRFKGF